MKGEFTRNRFSFSAPSSDATITAPKWIPHALVVFMSAVHRQVMPLMAFFWSRRDKWMSSPRSFLNASYCFTRSSCCLLQPSLSLPPASVIIFLYASVGRIIISYKNHLPSIVLTVKACCHYCPDFYYKFDA